MPGLRKGRPGFTAASEERAIPEAQVRQHNSPAACWVSFNGAVYDITTYIARHPVCADIAWAERVGGRRFEHFLGRDAFGPAHLNCGPDACCSRTVRKVLEQVLEPYRIGRLEPLLLSPAAQAWPEVSLADVELRIERPDGSCVRSLRGKELRTLPSAVQEVTHKCTSTGTLTTRRWMGVRVRDLLPVEPGVRPWDPLVTFVGMDGFGYSVLLSRAVEDDVILAYEQEGEELNSEQGGPLRLVKNGQHAKWVETIVLE